MALAGVAQLVGTWYRTPKGWGFDSGSEHIPRLWVRSNGCFSLTSMVLSLFPLPLSLKSINTFLKVKKQTKTLKDTEEKQENNKENENEIKNLYVEKAYQLLRKMDSE